LFTTLSSYYNGGKYSNGAALRLRPNGGVSAFSFDGVDGLAPMTGVVVDDRGLLYGTTGSWPVFAGNIFQIDHTGRETVLYNFCQQPSCADGYQPGGLLVDKSGNLFGMTAQGGEMSNGAVFELTP
jgi:hypothetical protein